MLKLGWFSTGRGEGSRGLLRLVHDQIASGDLAATIQFVFCNRDPGEHEGSDQFQALVESYGLPLVTLSSQKFRRERHARTFEEVRLDFDRETLRRLESFDPELCILAGYMLYTGPELCRRFTMLNLHPALPTGPIGTWQEVIWQLIQQQATETGAMIHLATEDWDRGPAITYFSFPIKGHLFAPLWEQVAGHTIEDMKSTYGEELPLFQRIRQEGVNREQPLLVETIRAFALGKVKVTGRQVKDAQARPIAAYCLNNEIDGWLRRNQS